MDRSGQTELEVRLEETGDNLESQKSVSLASKEKENSTDIPQKNDLLEELKRVNGSIFVLVEYLKMATAYKKSRIRKVSRGCGLDPILAADIADVIVTITELETITMLNAMLYIGQIMKNTKNSGG